MDFKDLMKQIAERVEKLKDNLHTEEATKNALIMPFIQALGYDVFNPLEVLPEMCCDIGIKKGEKIDYAIMKDDKPIMLIECKHWKQDLNLHDNQLLRYFTVSDAKFGVLTNGIIYRFYTDLVEKNKMDEKPFLEVNMLELRSSHIEELKKFHKSYFDMEYILSSANELKYMSELKDVISAEFTNPSCELVKFLGKQVYDGVFTTKMIETFTPLIKKTIQNHINEIISERLKVAIKENEPEKKENKQQDIPTEEETKDKNIETTEEEIEAFYIIKSILRNKIPAERITYKDVQSYFSVLIDNNSRKCICRLYLNSPTNKKLVFLEENNSEDTKSKNKEVAYKIECVDEIYNYKDNLINVALNFL